MTPDQISKLIVANIFPGGSPWIFLIFVFVVSGLGSYLAKYLEAKGQNLATREDFESLRHQLTQSTRTVEGIKAEFARTDWASREWTALRIRKIEEMMGLYSTLKTHIDDSMGNAFAQLPLPQWHNAEQAVVIAELYLPELLPDAIKLAEVVRTLPRVFADISSSARDRNPGREEDFLNGRTSSRVDAQSEETVKQIRVAAAELLKSSIANRAVS